VVVGAYLIATSPRRKGLEDDEGHVILRGGSPTLKGQMGFAFLLIALVLLGISFF
jgi:hypothetical protein